MPFIASTNKLKKVDQPIKENVVENTTSNKVPLNDEPPVREQVGATPSTPSNNVTRYDSKTISDMVEKAFEGTAGFMQSNEYSKGKLSSLYSIPGVKDYVDSLSNPVYSQDPTSGEQTSSFSGITNISKESLLNAIADKNQTQEETPSVRNEYQTQMSQVNPALDLQTIIMNVTGGQGLKQAEYTPLNVSNIYNSALSQMGIAGLEEQMAFVDNQVQIAQQNLKDRLAYERSKPQSLSVIGGKQSEIAKQQNEVLANLQDQKSALTNQIKTRYSIVDTIVKNAQLDYGYAVEYYDKQYKNNLSLVNNLWGMQKDLYSITEKQDENVLAQQKFEYQQKQDAKKSALANIKVVTDMIADQNLRLDQLPKDQQLAINKLEVQAGLPIGYTANMQAQVPDGKIISTTNRTDENNNEIADTLIQFSDGRFEVRSTLLGANYVAPKKASGGGGGGGGAGVKMTTLPSGEQMATTKYTALEKEAAEIKKGEKYNLSKQKDFNTVWNYLADKYTELTTMDLTNILGEGPNANDGSNEGDGTEDDYNNIQQFGNTYVYSALGDYANQTGDVNASESPNWYQWDYWF